MRAWMVVVCMVGMGCGGAEAEPAAPSIRERVDPAGERESAAESPGEANVAADPEGEAAGPSACASDADCGFDDACTPSRCVSPPPPPIACDESTPPPGECVCFAGQCALRPNTQRGEVTVEASCGAGCGLDVAGGACVPGREGDTLEGERRYHGPSCACEGDRCRFRWIEPIPCTSAADCWVDGARPVARPAALRRRTFRPCTDGELAPACFEGACTLVAHGC